MSKIRTITQFVEQRKGAFAVSVLIMRSGVRLREYATKSMDRETDLRRVVRALPEILNEAEVKEVLEMVKLEIVMQ